MFYSSSNAAYVDGAAHESAALVCPQHDLEHVGGQVFAEIVPLAHASREVGQRLRLQSTTETLVTPGQSARRTL